MGTQTNATNKKNIERPCWNPLEPTTATVPGTISPPLRNMSIMLVIIEGAYPSLPVKSVHHLHMIIKSMYPKRTVSKIIYGMNSKKKSSLFLK